MGAGIFKSYQRRDMVNRDKVLRDMVNRDMMIRARCLVVD